MLDIWVYRPVNSLIRRSRRRLGGRYERGPAAPRRDRELGYLIDTLIRTFTEVQTGRAHRERQSDLMRLQAFNRQLMEVGDIGQEINAALPYRETVERILARTKAFLHADFVALICSSPTRAPSSSRARRACGSAIDADCCLFTPDCPVRQAIDGGSRRALRRPHLHPVPPDHEEPAHRALQGRERRATWRCWPPRRRASTSTQIATNVLSTLQGHVHGALSNARKYDGIRRQVVTDHLTRLYNRRYFMNRAGEELERSLRNQEPLSLVMLDIDHFKDFNDSYGHATGDRVLQVGRARHAAAVRTSDICSRHGGEEFGMLLPNTPGDNANFMADRVRRTLGGTRYTGLGLPQRREHHDQRRRRHLPPRRDHRRRALRARRQGALPGQGGRPRPRGPVRRRTPSRQARDEVTPA